MCYTRDMSEIGTEGYDTQLLLLILSLEHPKYMAAQSF
jgi:hypothetical protein